LTGRAGQSDLWSRSLFCRPAAPPQPAARACRCQRPKEPAPHTRRFLRDRQDVISLTRPQGDPIGQFPRGWCQRAWMASTGGLTDRERSITPYRAIWHRRAPVRPARAGRGSWTVSPCSGTIVIMGVCDRHEGFLAGQQRAAPVAGVDIRLSWGTAALPGVRNPAQPARARTKPRILDTAGGRGAHLAAAPRVIPPATVGIRAT
jgi:hypothetical protein